jgi:hypothetical protein
LAKDVFGHIVSVTDFSHLAACLHFHPVGKAKQNNTGTKIYLLSGVHRNQPESQTEEA